MRLAKIEEKQNEVLHEVKRLGMRIEPSESIIHLEKVGSLEEFDEFDMKLKRDVEFRDITVSSVLLTMVSYWSGGIVCCAYRLVCLSSRVSVSLCLSVVSVVSVVSVSLSVCLYVCISICLHVCMSV